MIAPALTTWRISLSSELKSPVKGPSSARAHDLEQTVCDQLAGRASDGQFVLELLEKGELEVGELERCRTNADLLAAKLRSGKSHEIAELLEQMVQRIDLHQDRIEVAVCGRALGRELGFVSVANTKISLTVPAVRVRHGHQLRLIISGKESAASAPIRRDDKLIALVAEAFQARKLIDANPEKPIAYVAGNHGRCRTRLGTLVRLSCLAPDIVTAIVKRPAAHKSYGQVSNEFNPAAGLG